jgi:hypothetical protein
MMIILTYRNRVKHLKISLRNRTFPLNTFNFHHSTEVDLPARPSFFFHCLLFSGATQLLLELRLVPVSVFHGCDAKLDQARQKAANLALKYIRHLSKQQQQQNSSSMLVTTPMISQTA